MIKDLTTKMLLETVADHKLTILKDDELYRHLRIKKDGSRNRYYEIITSRWLANSWRHGDV